MSERRAGSMSERFRYRAKLAYVGTGFHGWQRQSNADRTVQAVLEEALASSRGLPSWPSPRGEPTRACTPTARWSTSTCWRPLEPDRMRAAVNSMLPWDAKLLSVAPAGPDLMRGGTPSGRSISTAGAAPP